MIKKLVILFIISGLLGQSVIGSGVGNTREEALKLAQRNAVEKAIGTSLISGTLIKNAGGVNSVMHDSIQADAAGFIKSYTIINEDLLSQGNWRVIIEAEVDELPSKGFFKKLFTLLFIVGGIAWVYHENGGEFLTINTIVTEVGE
jgi:hypothetical protein